MSLPSHISVRPEERSGVSASHPEAFIVLAAGQGTRMKSRTPKLLHAFGGRSILGHVLATAREQRAGQLIVVVGHDRERIGAHVREIAPEAHLVTQGYQGGTGNAVRAVVETLGPVRGTVVVANGDNPLIRPETCAELVSGHNEGNYAVTVLTARVPRPSGYGRIQRDSEGRFAGIVEERDASDAQRAIDEVNSGWYAFDGALLADVIKRLPSDNAQGQEYITDAVALLCADGHRAGTVLASDPAEIEGVNDRVYLARARRTYNDWILEKWMRSGVTIVDPATTWVDADVIIGQDAEIGPQTQLEGRTVIGGGARIGPGCLLENTTVGEDAVVLHTVSRGAEIGTGATVGPFAYLRPGTRIGENAHIGCHVELKNSSVAAGAKVPHLTYVGDADIGERANIGAGTIFANYDGVAKHHTSIGDDVFIGSDTVLVAPLTVGDGAYTAAGSAITEDVPSGDLGIARGRQHNSGGWVERNRTGTRSAEAASRARSESSEEKRQARREGE
jgi:bifunctional UDP-N-acetylglucosamine pyrophosphorylase/glucosamine-1-phosphate N-acetyltransferase